MEGEYPGHLTGVLSLFTGALTHLRIRILPVPGIEAADETCFARTMLGMGLPIPLFFSKFSTIYCNYVGFNLS